MVKAEQIGIYVTPKFVYGATIMNGVHNYNDVSSLGSISSNNKKISNGSDSAFGGSIAIGYDFKKCLNVPIRTEIEYAVFSETEIKETQSWGFQLRDYSYEERETFKQRFNVQTLFFNAAYDFHTDTAFTPYVTAGLGVAFIDTKAKWNRSDSEDGEYSYNESWSTASKTRSNFAWNVGVGTAYSFTENVALDLGYRFVGLGSVKTKTRAFDSGDGGIESYRGKTDDLYMHQVALGLRFSF